MNTINIFLKPTGSVAELEKDFPIYVGSYKTNYVKVYVLPTMMPVIENVNYGLALSGKFTLDNGSDFVAEPTWLEALPDETITSRNVETTYKVFGTYLPRKLCSYAGNQTLVLNLQSINSVTNEFISVITTQEANVLIQRSAYVLVDETPEPGQYEQINGRVTENEEDILDLQNDITDINTRIDNLPLSEDYIGSFSGTTQPFDDGVITDAMVALLNAEVADIKGESYVKKNGDVLIYTYQITGETDKNYKFIYTTNDTWTGYEIPALEVAGNGSLGIVEGTEGTGSTNDVIVDIGSGQIKNIKFKDNGNYVALGTIPTTYQTKAEGASKTYVREYSLPREFNDIYYLTNSGYQKEVPNTPSSGIQYTATSSSVGDTELFTCSFVNTADFELSAKNSTNNNVYIKATANATLQFRMTTQYRKNGEADWTDLSIELTGDIPFVANQLQKVQFGSAMTELGDDMVTMTNGDQLRQILEVITETSDTISFEIYSNSTYPSIFNLNTQLATLVIGNLLERMEGSEYVSVAENESNTKIEFKIPDNKVETSAPQNGSSKLITSGAVYNAIPQIDEVSITENASNKIQASKLKEKDVKIGENSVNKADFNGVVELSEAQYQELLANGTITVDGQTISFDETAYYNTPDDGGTTQVYTKAETNALLDEKVDKKPDGVNDLIDSNNKITDTYLPDYLLGQLLYGGTFNATTGVATLSDNAKAKLGVTDNTILLTNDTTPVTGYADNEGIFYVTSTTGTFADITFDVGDWLLSSGSAWQRIANTDAVTGVKGNAESDYRIGQVNLTPANIGTYSSSEIDTAVGAKLDKVITSDSNERVYAVDEHGTQEMKALESGTGMAAPTVNTVVLRGGGGVVSCGTPTQAYHAANKYYVDTYGGKIRKIFVNNTEVPIINNDEVHLTVPTTTNDLTNNSGFITNAVANLYNYYLKSETYSKAEVNNLISGITAGINLEVVAVLPTASEDTYFNTSKTIYLLAVEGSENNYYDEYITLRSGTEGSYTYAWEVIGSTQVDLSNYVQKTFTIAGVDMQDNITKNELLTALNVSDGANVTSISGSGAPTTSTVADFVGQLYLVTTNNKTYQCTEITTVDDVTSYTWKPLDEIKSISAGNTNLTPDTNGNVKIPYADYMKAGVVEILKGGAYGIDYLYSAIMPSGGSNALIIKDATEALIDARTDVYHPITPNRLNYAVKAALTDSNHLTMNATEQNTAKEILGLNVLTGPGAPNTSTVGVIGQTYKDTTNNEVYICDEITEDTSTNPSTFTYTWNKLIRAIDYASDSKTGVLKTNSSYGSKVLSTGVYAGTFMLAGASSTEIGSRDENLIPEYLASGNTCKPIVPSTLNFAVKSALTDANHLTMTSAEQATAQSVLGVNLQTILSAVTGYDASKTQVLKNISGTLTWVNET